MLHYIQNNQQCKDGDLLLLDVGAEYANYASDMSRTIPVSGKFTKRQKEVYNAVLGVKKEATKMLVPDAPDRGWRVVLRTARAVTDDGEGRALLGRSREV